MNGFNKVESDTCVHNTGQCELGNTLCEGCGEYSDAETSGDLKEPSELKKGFGVRLRRFRRIHKWNQAELSRRSGLNASAIWHLENRQRVPSFMNLIKLHRALGVSVDALTGVKLCWVDNEPEENDNV